MDFSGRKLSSRQLARFHINHNLVAPLFVSTWNGRVSTIEKSILARGLKWLVDIVQHGSE